MDRRHIKPLTSLRGIAAIFVFVHHLLVYYLSDVGLGLSAYTQLIHNGYLWVDFFFILSGFLLTLLYHEGVVDNSLSKRDFLIRRISRIYPLHLFVLALFLVLQLALFLKGNMEAFSGKYSLFDFFRSLFLMHAVQWHPFFTPWNGPSWSISAEWWAYLLFPWLVILVFRFRGRLASPLFWLTCAVALLGVSSVTTRQLDLTGYLGLMRCFIEFSMGIMLYSTVYRSGLAGKWLAHSGVQLTLFAGVLLSLHYEGLDVLSVFLMLLVVASVCDRETRVTRVLSHPWLIYLGTISYSIYMVHWFIFSLLDKSARLALGIEVRHFQTWEGNLSVGLICTLLVFITSVISFHLVEEPMRKRIPRLLGAA